MINIHSKDNKMPQKKIFLHIGQHKTGSSSIQEALLYNQSLLAQHGFSLFNKNPSGRANKTGGAHRWIHEEKISGKFDNVGHIVSPDKLAKQLSKLPGNIIISAEGFFWIQDKNNLHKLKEELDLYFDEIYIVAYLRRQDEQIISHHQEEAKFNEVAFFGGENKALPAYQEHFDYYLDYEKKMLMWGGVFGQKNIIIRVFDSGSLFQQDAVTDFFHLLKISDVEPIQKNTSTGFESTKINLLMSQAGLNKYYRGLLKIKNDTNKKFLPSRNEAEKFYNKYRKSNQRLNKKYRINDRPHIFHEDFSRYPEKSQDLWDEKSANHAISSIINNLNQIHPLMLVKIAIKLFIQSIKK